MRAKLKKVNEWACNVRNKAPLHKIFRDLKSEVKDVTTEEDRISFRIEQNAIFTKHRPGGVQIRLDAMNLYKLESGKVKEWKIWVNITEI